MSTMMIDDVSAWPMKIIAPTPPARVDVAPRGGTRARHVGVVVVVRRTTATKKKWKGGDCGDERMHPII